MAATTASSATHSYHHFPSSKMGKFAPLEAVSESSESSTSDVDQPIELPEQLKDFSTILGSAGFVGINENVYNKLRSMYPTVNSDALKRKTDVMLANLFKCDVYHHGCHFTTDNDAAFREHLGDNHSKQSLYCFYCTKADHHLDGCHEDSPHVVYNQADQLIGHITEQHARLNYQCNLCFYRAFSEEHVFIHQAVEHLSNFEETLKQVILDKKQHGEVSPIESAFLDQTIDSSNYDNKSDDDTEVENSEDDDDDNESDTVSSNVKIPKLSTSELCKIIVCNDGSAEGEGEEVLAGEYFAKHGVQFDSRNAEKYANLTTFLCAYCKPESSLNGSNHAEDFLVHVASAHNAFPILAYDVSSKISAPASYDFENLDDELAESIVSNFRQQLADNALARSYDDTLMNGAFEYYASLDSAATEASTSSKGVKRKLEREDADDQTDSTTPKRRRIFDRILSEPFLKQAKRVAAGMVTAGMAIGFYHLTHYLPESIQTYLN